MIDKNQQIKPEYFILCEFLEHPSTLLHFFLQWSDKSKLATIIIRAKKWTSYIWSNVWIYEKA